MRWLAGTPSFALLLAGCAQTVGGTAEPARSALTILPAEDEIRSGLRNTLSTFGYRRDAEASPISCAVVRLSSAEAAHAALESLTRQCPSASDAWVGAVRVVGLMLDESQ
jgi:hypothetical protein